MSGLSERQKAGCTEILQSLAEPDLLALKDTVTNRMITVESSQEALHAILAYSQSAEELLRRKKVHRDFIFRYLAKEGVVLPPTSEKHQLIKTALDYWGPEGTAVQAPKPSGRAVEAEGRAETAPGRGEQAAECQALGDQFCQWFFQLLNSQNPALGQTRQDWGPQHFWDDARLQFCYSTAEQQLEEYRGAELVSLRLLALARDEQLFLSPNLDPRGLKCVSSAHGLVVVAVAGTIHRERKCLGVFEQVFGLIRTPTGPNSWKIKFLNLKIRGQSALEGGEPVPAPAVTYEPSELRLFCG
ncbi:uncharacterized protein C3orf38 homolog [Amia ocellicauda]|uniref:uncharacterized protein C3orf38 homolog n=1 Tax=Amia ocellicauda TaxID=2972642 RepID=UPI003463E12A